MIHGPPQVGGDGAMRMVIGGAAMVVAMAFGTGAWYIRSRQMRAVTVEAVRRRSDGAWTAAPGNSITIDMLDKRMKPMTFAKGELRTALSARQITRKNETRSGATCALPVTRTRRTSCAQLTCASHSTHTHLTFQNPRSSDLKLWLASTRARRFS